MIEIDEDEKLLNHFYERKNMTKDSRNLCLFLVSNSKELDGTVNTANYGKRFDVVNMTFSNDRNKKIIKFNGVADNGEEKKLLDGDIIQVNNSYALSTKVCRLYEYLDDDDRDYTYNEVFEPMDDMLNRVTVYNDGTKKVKVNIDSF